jgi:hypothetical protein
VHCPPLAAVRLSDYQDVGSDLRGLHSESQLREVFKNNMAKSNVWRTNFRIISANLVTLTALAAALVFSQAAYGQAALAGGGPVCSPATLRGQYSWVGSGFHKLPDQNDPSKTVTVPGASIAFLTMDGTGKFDLLITVVFDGVMVRENFRTTDTYVVNSDCTGVLGSGIGPQFDILVVRDGSSFLLIDKNPGGTGVAEVKRTSK